MVSFSYDASGNLSQVTDVNGGTSTYTYDANHLMLSEKDPKCSATSGCPGIVNHYDSAGPGDVAVR